MLEEKIKALGGKVPPGIGSKGGDDEEEEDEAPRKPRRKSRA